AVFFLLPPFQRAAAQGVTSAAVAGRVTNDAREPVPSASLTLTNSATGVRYAARSADDGRFFFENVQVGTYVLDARALGHEPGRVPDIVLILGQRRVADVTLRRAAVELGAGAAGRSGGREDDPARRDLPVPGAHRPLRRAPGRLHRRPHQRHHPAGHEPDSRFVL